MLAKLKRYLRFRRFGDKFILIFAFYVVATGTLLIDQPLSLAAESAQANILKGNTYAAGALNLNYNTVSGLSLTLNPRYEYFLSDHFALGGAGYFMTSDNGNFLQLGPAATYFFWTQDRWASWCGLDVVDGVGTSPAYVTADVTLGLNYFITSSVAFGPTLQYSHLFITPATSAEDYVALLANFGVYFP